MFNFNVLVVSWKGKTVTRKALHPRNDCRHWIVPAGPFLHYILKHMNYWVKKKNRSVETTAVNNGQKKKLALKSQERCRRTRQALLVQTQLKTKPCHILLKLNSKEWSESMAIYSCFIMQCKLCLPWETELAAYKYIDIALRKHVEIR